MCNIPCFTQLYLEGLRLYFSFRTEKRRIILITEYMEECKLTDKQILLVGILVVFFLGFVILINVLDNYSLNGIKSKKVGNGQHGTAR